LDLNICFLFNFDGKFVIRRVEVTQSQRPSSSISPEEEVPVGMKKTFPVLKRNVFRTVQIV